MYVLLIDFKSVFLNSHKSTMATSANYDPRKKTPQETKEKFRKVASVVFSEILPEDSRASRPSLDSGIATYSGEWGQQQIAHLLKRTLIGVTKSELNHFAARSMEEAVDEILQSSPMGNLPINDYAGPDSDVTDPDVALGDSWVEAPYNNDLEGYRIISLKGWIIRNMLQQEATIQEKMNLFWHNLLATQFFSVFVGKASYQYYEMLHENAFGNFRELIKKLTVDPSMLLFLNGTSNNKEAPDENYSRELQELFCIGKGSGAGFTEGDVQAAARVLTGWVVSGESFEDPGQATSFFYHPWHDTNDKQFSPFYGNTIITGRSGVQGAEETDELLDMIFDTNEVALYICRRLYNFFVYHEIDEATESNVIVPLAEIFRNGNYEILPVLKALFKSEHFYDSANRGAVIKNPADHLLGLWKTFGMDLSELDRYESFYTHLSLNYSMAEVGMEIGDPPSVSGWQAYYQEPTFDRFWINTDTITKRALRQDSILFPSWGHWVNENLRIKADLPRFIETLDNPSDPNELINECSLLMHGIELSEEVRSGFKSILLSGQSDDFYWTDAWNLYVSDKSNEEYRLTVETRLVSLFQPFLQLAEFQLM